MRKSIEAALESERKAFELVNAKRAEILDRMRQEWIDVGGCSACGGTGRLTRHFSDGDEDGGPCPGWKTGTTIYGSAVYSDTEKNEGGYAAIVSYKPHCSLPADHLTVKSCDRHGLAESWTVNHDVACTAATHGPCPKKITLPGDIRDLEDLEESYRIAKELREACERDDTPHKGATVVVKRGRKVPLGTTGVIVWSEEQRFGGVATRRGGYLGGKVSTRLGLKVDGHEKLVYVSADNCDVVKPAIDVVLPPLWGSEKQVAWAERIRRDAMTAGTATDADLQNGTARFWIDNRERFAKGAA